MPAGRSRRFQSGLALAAATMVALAAVGYVLRQGGDSDAQNSLGVIDSWSPETGRPAPDFALLDARDGKTVRRLSDYRGKTVVLNWYASWCGPCRAELPDFEAAYRELDGEVVVLAVNLQESREKAVDMLRTTGATFPAVLDTDGAIANHYGVRGMPTTFFIDRLGILRNSGQGRVTEDALNGELAKLGHQRGGAPKGR